MRVTIIRDDGIVGIDGQWRSVDLSAMNESVRVVQWDGTVGHVEHYDGPNTPLETQQDFQSNFQVFVDDWGLPAQLPIMPDPTGAEMIAAAQARINAAYEVAVASMYSGYPDDEVSSWTKQETEARAWSTNNNYSSPWLDAAAQARGISKQALVTKIIQSADAFAPAHGALTGKRQKLRDQIDALGANPTQNQLDAVTWQG